MADGVLLLGGHVRKGAGVALGREQGVVAEAFGPGPLEGDRAPARAFDEVLLAAAKEANGRSELGGACFGGSGANAVELGEELCHVGFGVAVGAGVTCAQHAGRPFEGLDLQARVVREAIEPVVGDHVAGFELGIALKGRSILDDFLVAADVGQALDAVPVAEHFLEFAHLVGVVRGEHENGQLVVLGVAHAAKVRRRRDRDKVRV